MEPCLVFVRVTPRLLQDLQYDLNGKGCTSEFIVHVEVRPDFQPSLLPCHPPMVISCI